MITYGPFSYSEQEVEALYAQLREFARRKQVIHYHDSCAIVQPYGVYHGPRDQRLWYLLGYISEEEVRAGRWPLSAIVVIKGGEGANRPGHGFFQLERDLGRYKSDDETTWLAEIKSLFEYWPKH